MKITNKYSLHRTKQCKVTITHQVKEWIMCNSGSNAVLSEFNQKAPSVRESMVVFSCVMKDLYTYICMTQSFVTDKMLRERYIYSGNADKELV